MDHFAGFLKFLSTLKFLTTFALHFDFSVWGSAPTECRMIGKKWKKKLELMAPSGILDLDTLIKEGWEIHPKTIAFKCTGPARSHSYNVCTCTGDTVQRLAAGWGNH